MFNFPTFYESVMNGITDGPTGGLMDRLTDRPKDGPMDRPKDRPMDGPMDKRTNQRRYIRISNKLRHCFLTGNFPFPHLLQKRYQRIDQRTDRWTDWRMDRQTNWRTQLKRIKVFDAQNDEMNVFRSHLIAITGQKLAGRKWNLDNNQ